MASLAVLAFSSTRGRSVFDAAAFYVIGHGW
jgi:hypothetical protein